MSITILNKQECEESYLIYDDKIETTWISGRLFLFIKAKDVYFKYTEIYIPVDNIEYMEIEK